MLIDQVSRRSYGGKAFCLSLAVDSQDPPLRGHLLRPLLGTSTEQKHQTCAAWVGPGPALWPTKVSGSFSNNCVRNFSVSLTKAAVETDLSLMQCHFYGSQKGNPLCEMSWKEMQRVSAMEEAKTWVMHHRGTWQLQSRSLHAAANCKDKPSAHIIISTTVTRSSLCVCSESAKGTQMSASWKEIIIAQEVL